MRAIRWLSSAVASDRQPAQGLVEAAYSAVLLVVVLGLVLDVALWGHAQNVATAAVQEGRGSPRPRAAISRTAARVLTNCSPPGSVQVASTGRPDRTRRRSERDLLGSRRVVRGDGAGVNVGFPDCGRKSDAEARVAP